MKAAAGFGVGGRFGVGDRARDGGHGLWAGAPGDCRLRRGGIDDELPIMLGVRVGPQRQPLRDRRVELGTGGS